MAMPNSQIIQIKLKPTNKNNCSGFSSNFVSNRSIVKLDKKKICLDKFDTEQGIPKKRV